MIKKILLGIIITFISNVYAASSDEIVRQKMQAYLEKNNIPGAAVIVYVNGKPHTYYFGYADRENEKPVTDKTIFEIGSITKVMTSLLLAENLDYAKMQLNHPVKKYLPKLPEEYSDITIKSLATHTSGLPFKLEAADKTGKDWIQNVSDMKLKYDPAEVYQYSNVGMGVLGHAIESANHNNINNLYRKKILAPLGMQEIGVSVPKQLHQFIAKGYDAEGEPVPSTNDNVFPAAAAMKLSVSDMQRFLSAAIGLPKTPESIFYPMRMTQTPYIAIGDHKQGLGWEIHDIGYGSVNWLTYGGDKHGLEPSKVDEIFDEPTFNGDSLIDKTGATNGFRAYVGVIPNKKTGIAILVNRNIPDNSIKMTAREILFKLNDMA